MSDVLLFTPPFTQLNTPYPATAYLKGFLNIKGISSCQLDLGLEVILRLFSKNGLTELFRNSAPQSENSQRIYTLRSEYIRKIDTVIRFLQGKSPEMARQIAERDFLPEASRFSQVEDLEWYFGQMGFVDKAKHLATLMLEDLSDYIREEVDQYFGFSRYAEHLGMSANSFDEMYDALLQSPSIVDGYAFRILEEYITREQPSLVCLSVPFPGNLYSGLRCGQWIKANYPHIKIAMGGGFANTELRSVKDSRVFEFWDYICLDDGELPLELVIDHVLNTSGDSNKPLLKRTFHLEEGEVIYNNYSLRKDYQQADVGTPDYNGLDLDRYISVIGVKNPMHALWSDGQWLKLTMAHGCYWGKCTFCDVSLSYIKDYEPIAAAQLVDRMEEMMRQTNRTGFHFVDEAAPPALMRALAIEILNRGLVVSWWTNIRFEKNFTADLCRLLKASGCIAVSGGLEVASDRLLKLIDKGVTVEQVAQVTRNFTDAGILVHSYLMYGYPTQSVQETIDSLEMVRQLFEIGVIQSGFWHQFALTAHSPIGLKPEAYGVIPQYEAITFANNDVQFEDETGIDAVFSEGLKKSLYNFMHGVGFDLPLQDWFDFEIPKTTIHPHFITSCLEEEGLRVTKPGSLIMWIGNDPVVFEEDDIMKLELNSLEHQDTIELELNDGKWLLKVLSERLPCRYSELKKDYEQKYDHFEALWYSDDFYVLRAYGLLES